MSNPFNIKVSRRYLQAIYINMLLCWDILFYTMSVKDRKIPSLILKTTISSYWYKNCFLSLPFGFSVERTPMTVNFAKEMILFKLVMKTNFVCNVLVFFISRLYGITYSLEIITFKSETKQLFHLEYTQLL